MFSKILEHIGNEKRLSEASLNMLKDLCQFWKTETSNTLEKLELINNKYQFENLIKLRRSDSYETHLNYWKDGGQFGLSPAIEDHDIDMDFILFVRDFYDHATFSNYVEINNDDELNDYFEYLDRIFYSWFAFLWQESRGMSTGVPTCTVENNSSIMFYFNDFLWSEFSQYHDKRENERVDGSAFTRKLSIVEIYARTNRNLKRKDKEIIWEFNDFNEITTLEILNNKTTTQMRARIDEIIHEPNTNYDNSNVVAAEYFIAKSNELINNGWELKESKSR